FENQRRSDAGQGVGVVRLEFQRLLEQRAGVGHCRGGRWQIEYRLAAHDQVGEFGAVRPLTQAAPRFRVDDLQADCAGDSRDDLVLKLEDAPSLGVEAL